MKGKESIGKHKVTREHMTDPEERQGRCTPKTPKTPRASVVQKGS